MFKCPDVNDFMLQAKKHFKECTSLKAFFSAFISSFLIFFAPILPVVSFGSNGKPPKLSPSVKL